MRRLDSRFAVGAVKTLQPGVPEALNHLYSVLIRYTIVKEFFGVRLIPEVRLLTACTLEGSAGYAQMNSSDQDRYWMQRALELARRGIGLTSPNPAVGCVILDRAGQVAGEGWHEYDLVDHAEVVALKVAQQHAGNRLRGGTAYVTLEPCNHTGRTPPCTER